MRYSLFILTLLPFTCFLPAASASAHMSPATISDELPVNPRNVMTEDFPPTADSEEYKSAENPASSAAPSAGEVGIPAILPSSRPINRGGLIETKAASISPETPTHNKLAMIYKAEAPKIPAGVFSTRKLMTSAVEANSPESPGYVMSDDLSAAAPAVVYSSP